MESMSGTTSKLSADDINNPLLFFKKLQAITNKIYATSKVEEIMTDLSKDICELFGCDRLTLYAVSADKMYIESKVKTGMRTFKHFALPISEKNIAGFVALSKKSINISDVYDENELKVYSAGLEFLQKVDTRTGYRTKQMLVAPLLNAQTGELLGVAQLINNLNGEAFSPIMEDGLKDLCDTLALAFAQRLAPPLVVRSKYDILAGNGVISKPELELALRAARRKHLDLEEVLVNEFQVKLSDIGAGLSEFFDVPYEPYKEDRVKPVDALKNFKRVYVVDHRWLLLEENGDNLVVLATDPDSVKGSRIVQQFFPKANLTYLVTTNIEFKKTVDQFFGPGEDPVVLGEEMGDLPDTDEANAAEELLIKRVNKIIADAFAQHAPDIKIELHHDKNRNVHRLRNDGSLESLRGKTLVEFFAKVS